MTDFAHFPRPGENYPYALLLAQFYLISFRVRTLVVLSMHLDVNGGDAENKNVKAWAKFLLKKHLLIVVEFG